MIKVFYTSRGRFVDRYEATKIAFEAGQLTKSSVYDKQGKIRPLFSEDLYC